MDAPSSGIQPPANPKGTPFVLFSNIHFDDGPQKFSKGANIY